MSKSSTWRYYDVAVALFVASLLTANIIAVKLIEIGPLICRRASSSFRSATSWATF